jgi:hypothetical protein
LAQVIKKKMGAGTYSPAPSKNCRVTSNPAMQQLKVSTRPAIYICLKISPMIFSAFGFPDRGA